MKTEKTENHKLTASLETITPEMASEYLTKNYENNRKLRRHTVESIAEQIKRNQWVPNGATICFSASGFLTDGQHRLAGCVQSRKPIESLVARNVPDKAFMTQDTGRTRTNADILHISGEINAAILACSARYLFSWEKTGNFGWLSKGKISSADTQAVLRRHPGLRDAIAEVSDRNVLIKRLGPSFISTFFYLISTINHDEALAFYNHLFEGTDLSKGHPVLFLRNMMIARAQEGGRALRFDPYGIARLWTKAWNLFCKGERIEKLAVKDKEEGLDKLETPKGSYKVRYQIT